MLTVDERRKLQGAALALQALYEKARYLGERGVMLDARHVEATLLEPKEVVAFLARMAGALPPAEGRRRD